MLNLLLHLGCASRRPVLLTIALPALFGAAVLLLPLCIGVWLPDLWSGAKTLSDTRTPSGHRFRVVQTWGDDFYTTELVQTLPNGTERRGLIDGDAGKWWHADLTLDEARQRVTLNGRPYRWPRSERDDLRLILRSDGTVLSGIRSNPQ